MTETQTVPRLAGPVRVVRLPSRSTSRPASTRWQCTRTSSCSSAWWRPARTSRRSGPRWQPGSPAPCGSRTSRSRRTANPKCRSRWSPSPSGYRIDAHRLGFGSIHALFTCRQQGFLPNDSDDALWQELKQERFTTPMLRGWLPYVRKELELKNLLSRCYTLDCTCCILTATSADLDSIVEFGLKNGSISIQEEPVGPSNP